MTRIFYFFYFRKTFADPFIYYCQFSTADLQTKILIPLARGLNVQQNFY
jgi:hypothetical protein